MIIPKQLGYIAIRATANSVLAGDSVEHKLLVNVTIFSSSSLIFLLRVTMIKLRKFVTLQG